MVVPRFQEKDPPLPTRGLVALGNVEIRGQTVEGELIARVSLAESGESEEPEELGIVEKKNDGAEYPVTLLETK